MRTNPVPDNMFPLDVKGDPKIKAAHAMGRPKCPGQPVQCISCPFRDGNDKEFGKIVEGLARINGQKTTKVSLKKLIKWARFQVRTEATHRIDFACHQTAYKPDMSLRDFSEHRQCPGATKVFKGED